MFKVIFLICVTAMISSTILFANEEEKTIEQKLASLKLERIQAEGIIKKMKLIGRFNEKEVAYATRSIASIKEEDLKNIRTESLENLSRSNSMANK